MNVLERILEEIGTLLVALAAVALVWPWFWIADVVPGPVIAGSISGSVFNSGNQPAGWNGSIIPAGVSIPWGPVGNRDTYGAIPYDPTITGPGTTLIIEYTT